MWAPGLVARRVFWLYAAGVGAAAFDDELDEDDGVDEDVDVEVDDGAAAEDDDDSAELDDDDAVDELPERESVR